ncbi:MAG TPA: histidine kinase dimerization/phospho-acceptor domain-containing protein [Patescibacteria group bacterium]|nr:histidine kinase dimerization/phospho-acceptor domain-containing protein [Patescibacteria group bacterium]
MKTSSEWRHDLRSPLTVIKGYVDFLLVGDDCVCDDRAHEYLKNIKQATDRMIGLLDEWRNEEDE